MGDEWQVRPAAQLEPELRVLFAGQHGWPVAPHAWQVPLPSSVEQKLLAAVQM